MRVGVSGACCGSSPSNSQFPGAELATKATTTIESIASSPQVVAAQAKLVDALNSAHDTLSPAVKKAAAVATEKTQQLTTQAKALIDAASPRIERAAAALSSVVPASHARVERLEAKLAELLGETTPTTMTPVGPVVMTPKTEAQQPAVVAPPPQPVPTPKAVPAPVAPPTASTTQAEQPEANEDTASSGNGAAKANGKKKGENGKKAADVVEKALNFDTVGGSN